VVVSGVTTSSTAQHVLLVCLCLLRAQLVRSIGYGRWQQQWQGTGWRVGEGGRAAVGQASFVAEMFFIAQRYMRVGLMPAVHR
jgi:hypothetical protein